MGRVYGYVGDKWADYNERGEGRGAKRDTRVSFEGRHLYSYATLVAAYHVNEKGQKYVLATSRRYSVSTSSHVRACVGSCTVPVFYVPEVLAPNRPDNGKHLWDMIEAHILTAKRTWKNENCEVYYRELVVRWFNEFLKFCDITGFDRALTNYRSIYIIHDEIIKHIQDKRAEFFSSKNIEKRERAAARRAAKKALQL